MNAWTNFGHISLAAIAAAATLAVSTPAHAALDCNFATPNVVFGDVDVTLNTQSDSTTTLQINCSGGTASQQVRVCPNLGAGTGGTTTGDPRFLLFGAAQLNYNLYSDAGRTTVWGSYLWGFAPQPPTLNITLDGTGSLITAVTIYARLWSGQQTALPGTYASDFSSHSQIAYADASFGDCAAIGSTNAKTVTLQVSANVVNACRISSTTHDFGTAGLLNVTTNTTSTVTATCSATTPYTISLDGGTSGAADPTQRKMSKGGEHVTYGLYHDAGRAQAWGSTLGVNMGGGTGSGLGQNYTVYGQVLAQPTPSAGVYTDTIVTTVTY